MKFYSYSDGDLKFKKILDRIKIGKVNVFLDDDIKYMGSI